MPSKQVVTIGKRTFPVTYRDGGPTITGVFSAEEKRIITSVYGVKIVDPSQKAKFPTRR